MAMPWYVHGFNLEALVGFVKCPATRSGHSTDYRQEQRTEEMHHNYSALLCGPFLHSPLSIQPELGDRSNRKYLLFGVLYFTLSDSTSIGCSWIQNGCCENKMKSCACEMDVIGSVVLQWPTGPLRRCRSCCVALGHGHYN